MRLILFYTTLLLSILAGISEKVDKSEIHYSSELQYSTVLVSTIDGVLHALDTLNGKEKWKLREEPVLRAPNSVKQGFTFIPNPQDGSIYIVKEGTLTKLPFTIPQLVSASPCRGNDGVLYAGSKKDAWFGIDPNNGAKVETLSAATAERVCPANQRQVVFLGRTVYSITMFDVDNRGKTWNASFSDYSAHLLPVDNGYKLRHYVSSSSGNLLAVDSGTGQIVWSSDLDQPIVAMYLLQDDGLHKVPFTVMGRETMEHVVESAFAATEWNMLLSGSSASQNTLYPTLYVGESPYGLYAMNSFVDQRTITYAPKYLGPPLLDGPAPIALTDSERAEFTSTRRPIVQIDFKSITHKTIDGEFILLGNDIELSKHVAYSHKAGVIAWDDCKWANPRGRERTMGGIFASHGFPSFLELMKLSPEPFWGYHEPPPLAMDRIISRFPFATPPTFPHIEFKPEPHSTRSVGGTSKHDDWVELVWNSQTRQPRALLGLLLTLLLVFVSTIYFLCNKQTNEIAGEARSAQTSRSSQNGRLWGLVAQEQVPDGWMNIGKLLYNPAEILGRGCEGTVVYRGRFDGREVAVKRVVAEFVRLVDREADLLRESDAHPHVIRYFCMESDSQFRYLALELCVASLTDYVDAAAVREKLGISETDILREATDGLAHLHSMNIVHRDMKPQNVLLSMSGQKRRVRVVISDFGLCKRIQDGRQSLSRRSGLAGTDGWIAPEALFDQSTSHAVDVFSLGCIFYYVLTLGSHPFGDNLHRQSNILSGNHNLSQLNNTRYSGFVVQSLVEAMIEAKPTARPSAESVLLHPFFWPPHRQLQFFGDVSDRVEKEGDTSAVVKRLEANGRVIVSGNWRQAICQPLADDLRKFRTYNGHSVRDLLRAMRNKKHHYRELPEAVRNSMGHIPEQFVAYFTSRFPKLLLHSYEAMKWCSDEPVFRTYYSQQVRDEMREEVADYEARREEDMKNMESEEWVRAKEPRAKPANMVTESPKAKSNGKQTK